MKIKKAKEAADIVKVIEGYGITLQQKGAEMVGLCPFHTDSRPSMNVHRVKQVFYCPVCDTKGDVLDFVMLKENCTVMEAVDRISDERFTEHVQQVKAKTGAPQDWKQIKPTGPPGQIVHHLHGKPSKTWEYTDGAGALLGLICRFDLPAGKEILPYTYRQNGDLKKWQFRGFDRPRPLYNLKGIHSRPTATVCLGEGEKTADAIGRLLPKTVATAWQGGAKAIKATDWAPLKGRKIILWPDNDVPGLEAMILLANHLKDQGISNAIQIVLPPQDKPKGWDLADAEIQEWTPDQVRTHTLENLHAPDSAALADAIAAKAPTKPAVEPEPPAAQVPEPPPDPPKPPTKQAPKPQPETGGNNRWFEVLGFVKSDGRQSFCFYIKAARIVVTFAPAALGSKTNLLTLAPLDYWEDTYPSGKRGSGFSVEMAVQVLIAHSNQRGVFTTRMMRGRGAWFDANRVVLHLGTHLLVNGTRVELGQMNSRFVYEAGEAMEINTTGGLETVQSARLMEVTRLLNWDRQINAYLLAGWAVIAPFCGALKWRPHIWLSGGAGTGKSWVFREIVRRLLGGSCLAVQSETSEAGLRQMLASDAIPVVFDEAEGETRHSMERMEHVLALMRSASSSDGGIVAKGTSTGRGQTFEIRSCFACASINSPITLQADRTRVTPLTLTPPDETTGAEQWVQLQKIASEVLTDDFVAGLQARTLRLLPVILQNADVFGAAVTALLGTQRIGDQLGAMLAGAYSLHSTHVVDYGKAMEFIQGKDWNEEKVLKDTKDELHLLATMAEKLVRVDGLEGTPVERNLGELVRIAAGFEVDERLHVPAAQDRLKRLGFRVDGEYLLVSTGSDQMRGWMIGTAWAKNWYRTLARVAGAEMVANVRFASGIQTRAVRVPLSFFK